MTVEQRSEGGEKMSHVAKWGHSEQAQKPEGRATPGRLVDRVAGGGGEGGMERMRSERRWG